MPKIKFRLPVFLRVYGAYLILRGLCTLYQPMHVTVLPAYHPSQQEQNDPNLFAENVRKYISKFSGLPITNQGRIDNLLIAHFQQNHKNPKIREVCNQVDVEKELFVVSGLLDQEFGNNSYHFREIIEWTEEWLSISLYDGKFLRPTTLREFVRQKIIEK